MGKIRALSLDIANFPVHSPAELGQVTHRRPSFQAALPAFPLRAAPRGHVAGEAGGARDVEAQCLVSALMGTPGREGGGGRRVQVPKSCVAEGVGARPGKGEPRVGWPPGRAAHFRGNAAGCGQAGKLSPFPLKQV